MTTREKCSTSGSTANRLSLGMLLHFTKLCGYPSIAHELSESSKRKCQSQTAWSSKEHCRQQKPIPSDSQHHKGGLTSKSRIRIFCTKAREWISFVLLASVHIAFIARFIPVFIDAPKGFNQSAVVGTVYILQDICGAYIFMMNRVSLKAKLSRLVSSISYYEDSFGYSFDVGKFNQKMKHLIKVMYAVGVVISVTCILPLAGSDRDFRNQLVPFQNAQGVQFVFICMAYVIAVLIMRSDVFWLSFPWLVLSVLIRKEFKDVAKQMADILSITDIPSSKIKSQPNATCLVKSETHTVLEKVQRPELDQRSVPDETSNKKPDKAISPLKRPGDRARLIRNAKKGRRAASDDLAVSANTGDVSVFDLIQQLSNEAVVPFQSHPKRFSKRTKAFVVRSTRIEPQGDINTDVSKGTKASVVRSGRVEPQVDLNTVVSKGTTASVMRSGRIVPEGDLNTDIVDSGKEKITTLPCPPGTEKNTHNDPDPSPDLDHEHDPDPDPEYDLERRSDPVIMETAFDLLCVRHEALCGMVREVGAVGVHHLPAVYANGVATVCFVVFALVSHALPADLTHSVTGVLVSVLMTLITATCVACAVNEAAKAILTPVFAANKATVSPSLLQKMQFLVTRLTAEEVGYHVYGLFVVSRSNVLMIGGTILTYTVVVVQFQLEPTCNCPSYPANLTLM